MKVDWTDIKLIHIMNSMMCPLVHFTYNGYKFLIKEITKIVKYGYIVHDGALGVTLRHKESGKVSSRLLLTSKSYPSVYWCVEGLQKQMVLYCKLWNWVIPSSLTWKWECKDKKKEISLSFLLVWGHKTNTTYTTTLYYYNYSTLFTIITLTHSLTPFFFHFFFFNSYSNLKQC